MDLQDIRRNNLRRILDDMDPLSAGQPDAAVAYLGNPVRPERLMAMINGSHIGTFFVRHVEHFLRLERGWMDHPHEFIET